MTHHHIQNKDPHFSEQQHSQSPTSRHGTPGFSLNTSNIAPQHLFDGVTLDGTAFQSASMNNPSNNLFIPRQPSPNGSISGVMSGNISGLHPPQTYDALFNQNTTLKTRVSELEVINDLFHGRVSELEAGERDVRRNEAALKQELEDAKQREEELKRRVEELKHLLEIANSDEGRKGKRMRMSDVVDVSGASTPLSLPAEDS